ncbi:MAG TPA: porin [Psychromonas hadalis]|nr:porin [Psychromonas hadalis]
MKKLTTVAIAITAALASTAAFASSSYVTGNVQQHDREDFNGSGTTSTLEAGHTFDSNTTLLVEFDGIQLGATDYGNNGDDSSAPAFITLGVEQMFNINEKLWVAVGYHHLLHDGDTYQYRPLVKIGYNFDNGISISNRTRGQIMKDDWKNEAGIKDKDNTNDQVRFDNRIAYAFSSMPVAISYNNIYYINDADNKDNSMEHELRTTWTRDGVQPYVEYRNQEDAAKHHAGHNNNVLVLGASYGF